MKPIVSPLSVPPEKRWKPSTLTAAESAPRACVPQEPPAEPSSVKYRALARLAVVVAFLFVAYLIADPLFGNEGLYLLNRLGPAILFAACSWTAYDIVRLNPRLLWTPIPWFLAASALFFGIGPLSYPFGGKVMVAYMDIFCPVYPQDLLRTNLLNTAGIFLITAAFLSCSRFLDRRRPVGTACSLQTDRARAVTGLYVFLGIGLPLQYLLILPYEFGRLSFTLPGVVVGLSGLVSLGVFLLAYLATRFGQSWTIFFWVLLASEIVVEFLRFQKTVFLMVLIMAVLGRFLASRKMAELTLGVLCVFSIYVTISPIVGWSRHQIVLARGDHYHASLEERLAIVEKGIELWSRGRLDLDRNGSWWMRLSYANAQTLAMSQYDSGWPGNTLELILYAPIPRFLWKEKPIITPGADFNELAGQGRNSQTAPGLFAEAYWNGGWLFVVLSCCYVGVLFAWLSRIALTALAQSQWLLLPCAFLGIQSGILVTDWFAAVYVNGMLLYLAYYLLIRSVTEPKRLQTA